MPNVIHFLGGTNPTPMRQSEANRMLGKADESTISDEVLIEPFLEGETVKIIDGPFKDFVGDVIEVNEEKRKLKVVVKIFGRGTEDRKSTRLNSSHVAISYAVFCLKKKKTL